MARWLLFVFWTAAVVATGCGQKPAPPPAQVEPKTAVANPPPTVSSTANNPASLPAAVPTAVKPIPVASPLRDLAARYLESDGQGGWRKNEPAATELEKLGPEGTDQLWPLLADAKVEVRRGAAVYLLNEFDPADSNQTAAFSKLLDDSDRTVRSMGLNALRQFQRDDQVAALPQIGKLLDAQHEDRPENRAAAARICGALKSDAAGAFPGLQRAALTDPDAKVRGPALFAIAQIVEPEKAASVLSQGLTDRDATVRRVAVARLKQLGARAVPATSMLATALADSNTDVAESAAEALILIGRPAVEPLAGQLVGSSVPARKLALACLAKIGPAAKDAVPRIEGCKQDADPQVRQLAEAALKRIKGP